ncbi:uncharacterized protein LOC111800741 isoform X1 [Cucurbita pepo subsp. pepo]|uniref:uncharacterized protein LOC111800741 isoform X1 n=1 Tax=Cucurbita pepo subsp. pepo TaxID=3664 RepID=UPI000C9D78A5|nr:uncharacterized protein LOC111800741 isoform X1 [Cucurbita pepo subsp. pepo]XP_023540335.1 uncharacterized protein LOC111800741 isoform X1 [Cucurbita pepo subsp. pepo]XP_023540336.1 uncharacterized protein LOC111800741 isoform X1 [Cucurbita pepo subsp. pepo]XP_023540337.1 uncharacterized protein LOC111800741 isoform X1 [Cucurbita pepo subsp. pepo]XP_023540338.1 uncharacterized protein LOC111800741 isoform X1 [Cucurbita pepo subsp. pepo]XP_023540339.1 uncharacterized protein LOC111800741 iso
MAHTQLIDSLTSHISLYHSTSFLMNHDSKLRSSIRRWFSSLTVHQRQAHLTVVDFKFVQILIQMVARVRRLGHGFFILLPDVPSSDPLQLPGLCFKKSRGLLSRVSESSESERMIFESCRLFGSREGDKLEECSCSLKNIDSLTVSEEFVANVDKFFKVMDVVSNGWFLRGEGDDLTSDWAELNWLKAKGYYSIEAFVANQLEVALRLAWMNLNTGKKRSVKLKEKARATGMATNVFWRKKGCVDWWDKLDASSREKLLTSMLGKSAKQLIHEILRWTSGLAEHEMGLFSAEWNKPFRYNCTISPSRSMLASQADLHIDFNIIPATHSGKPSSLSNIFRKLLVLQDIVTMVSSCLHDEYYKSNLFYSTLGSICAIPDCILRKLREFLMFISLDCTKLELLGEGNSKSLPSKSTENLGASRRRKKGKSRKSQNPVPKACVGDLSCNKFHKPQDFDKECAHKGREDMMESTMPILSKGNDSCREMSADVSKTVHDHIMSVGKNQGTTRKKKKHKSKNFGGNNRLVEIIPSEGPTAKFSSPSFSSQDQVAELDNMFRKPFISNIKNDSSNNYDSLTSNSSPIVPSSEPNREYNSNQNVEVHEISGLTESVCHVGPGESQFPKGIIENECVSSALVPSHLPSLELKNIVKSDVNVNGSVRSCELREKSSLLDKLPRTFDIQEKSCLSRDQFSGDICNTRTLNSSFNSHLPPATDRLHLDAGHNWHNHFRRSFTPAMHQPRSSSVKGGCNPILTRPLLMSLDWPPVLRSASGLASTMTSNHDFGFLPRRQSTFRQGFPTNSNQISTEDEKYSGNLTDFPDLSNNQDLADECDGNWISEEELEMHAVSGLDYNQYFGGGVMYWNPSDHHGTGFSRPPSLSSDDSSWAWREADMNRTVDDMVAFSSSYSNGLASPTATSFCSPFDPLGSGKQALGYVVQGPDLPTNMLHSSLTMNDSVTEEDAPRSLANLPSDVEGKTGDSHPFPMLPPIVIPNMSRERSRSEFCHGFDHKSPCIPPTRREQSRVKRPPSPVVLCVPRAPIPPPPSPVSDSRKHRGFPTVRSGSSSPRHWGVKGWYPDGTNLEEACLHIDGAEVVWPTWRNKSNSNCSTVQPLSLIAMSQIALDQEHPDVAFPLFPPTTSCPVKKESLSLMHSRLNDEINSFCKHVAAENMTKKPYITWAVKRVTRSLQVLWPRSRTNIFGSNATGLSLPTSDVDLVVCLPPVRNLEPIKEAGILEGRNGIKETCLQHAARYLSNQEWVKSDSLKTVENTAIPIIMLVVEVPHDLIASSTSNMQSSKEESSAVSGEQDVNLLNDMASLEDSALQKCLVVKNDSSSSTKSVRIDISFKTPSHTGLQTSGLVKKLTEQFPATIPLALVLKMFLADRSLDQSYSGGLSSYCLVLLIVRFLQHEHHLSRPINQNFGSLLMDFLYFFGNVFDPRQMRISIQGSGVYIKRERGYSIDPLHIDDPLFPMNNVGRNCFRIHQCIKAFSEAYSILESELISLNDNGDSSSDATNSVLQKIIPSIDLS